MLHNVFQYKNRTLHPGPNLQATAVDRFRTSTIWLIWAGILVAGFTAPWVNVRWSAKGIGLIAVSLALLLVASQFARWRLGRTPLADIADGLAYLMLAGLLGGAIAMLSLRWGTPMADGILKDLDALMGLSAMASLRWFATWPPESLSWLHSIYETSFPQIAITAVALPLLGRSIECWRLIVIFVGASLSAAIITFAVPAMGAYVAATPDILSAMPRGAGTYAFEAVYSFKQADRAVLDLDAIGGVITFPSVHTVLALLAVQAWWWQPILRWLLLLLNVVVIVTTIPIGGHYFIDLLGGLVLWLAWTLLARQIERGETAPPGPGAVLPLTPRNPPSDTRAYVRKE